MSRRSWIGLANLLIAAALSGCGPKAEDAATTAGGGAPAAAQAPAAPLKPVDRAEYDALLAKRKDKVVLVDFWATWCGPCLAQLPHTAELARAHAGEGLAVITVSVDEMNDAERAARVVADKVGGAAANFISADGGGPDAMEAFEIAAGSVPHYKLYDRTGALRHAFEVDPTAERQFTAEDIEAAVKRLLAE